MAGEDLDADLRALEDYVAKLSPPETVASNPKGKIVDAMLRTMVGGVRRAQTGKELLTSAAEGAKRAVTAPVRAMRGEIAPEDMAEEAMNSASLVGGAGTMFARPHNSLGMFGGPKALSEGALINTQGRRRFGRKAIEEAEDLLKNSATKDEIWAKTGLYKDSANNWRYEIPDDEMVWKGGSGAPQSFWNVINHPKLAHVYDPELHNKLKVIDSPGLHGGYFQPWYDKSSKEFSRGEIAVGKMDGHSPESIAAHELQHFVQAVEKLPRGGNYNPSEPSFPWAKMTEPRAVGGPGYFDEYIALKKFPDEMLGTEELARKRVLEEVMKTEDKLTKAWRQSNFNLYENVPGEREARNVSTRLKMTPEERVNVAPWVTEDPVKPIMPAPEYNRLVDRYNGYVENLLKKLGGPRRDAEVRDALFRR